MAESDVMILTGAGQIGMAISMLVNAAGVSPSQAPVEAILKVDLYGTADEIANVAELLMSSKGAFITGSAILIDGGATASYYYGPLKPTE